MNKSAILITTLSLTLSLSAALVQAEEREIPMGYDIQEQAEKNTTTITTAELQKMLDEEPDLVLIDLRSKEEIQNMDGKIDAPQNVNIRRGWLEFQVQRYARKDTPIVVYCGGGRRSPLAAETLQNMGYTNVKNYAEGFFGWKKAGLPIKP